ncbi:MAG: tRNA 2-thiouridine(34) synthase MnmA [Acidobacteriota bacterium]
MRVVVAMSGGVDSAVAAAVLLRQGHDVMGVTLRLADLSAAGLGVSRCCAPSDIETARRVAWELAFPHQVLDLKAVFHERVLQPFLDSYLTGETPLPCARCNSAVKLGRLLELAPGLGVEAVATGHYARLEPGADGGPVLLRGIDRNKDQSYFLFELTREQLRAVMFPLGEMSKEEVRALARELGLPNASRPESQEVCFVPEEGSYVDVLERLVPGERLPGRGEVVDAGGRVLGEHAGFHRFTVGQRRGIGVAAPERLYVVGLDPAHNRVIVGRKEEALRGSLELRDVNWLAPRPGAPIEARVQIRSRHEPACATVIPGPGGAARVDFAAPVLAPAPGQAAVFYNGDRLLGGGWIVATR